MKTKRDTFAIGQLGSLWITFVWKAISKKKIEYEKRAN